MRASTRPDCATNVARDRQRELCAGEPSVSGDRGELRHREARVGTNHACRSVNGGPRTSIQDDQSADSRITDHHIAATPKDRQRPATTLCKANSATEGEAITNGCKKICWSANPHRGVLSKGGVTFGTNAETTLELASRLIAFAPNRHYALTLPPGAAAPRRSATQRLVAPATRRPCRSADVPQDQRAASTPGEGVLVSGPRHQ